jgi:hypothetical protein
MKLVPDTEPQAITAHVVRRDGTRETYEAQWSSEGVTLPDGVALADGDALEYSAPFYAFQ